MKTMHLASILCICVGVSFPITGWAKTRAYIANTGADEIIRVVTTDEVLSTISVKGAPYGVAVTPDGQQVLVTNTDNDEMVFIDTDDFSGEPIGLPVGKTPRGVAVEPTGRYAYVANFEDDTISKIDVTRRLVVATITVGDGPWGVVAHHDQALDAPVAYVTNHNDDDVLVIDQEDQTTTVNVGDGPIGLAITPDGGYVYVANRDDDTVSVLDTRQEKVIDTISVGDAPWGVAVGADGKFVYVTNSGADTVTVIRTADHSIASTFSVGDEPTGIAAPRNGNFAYVINRQGGSISKIEMDNETVTELAAGQINDAYAMGAFIGDKPPASPNGLEAAAQDQSRIDLSWTDRSTNELGFKIERSQEDEDGYVQIGTVDQDVTTYEDAGLISDTLYFYRIRSYNESADSTYSGSADATTERYTGSIWCFIDILWY